MADPLVGVGFAVLAAVGLTVQSLLVLLPVAGVVEYLRYDVTLGSLVARSFRRDRSARGEPNR